MNKSAVLHILSLVVLLALSCGAAKAQVDISGVINTNTAVVDVTQPSCSDCEPTCRDTIEVDDASSFRIGDRALIIQMKGATINTANTSSGGQITDIANAGNYEFFIIDSILATGDIIIPRYKLVKGYDEAGQVQVIRIPNYGSFTVNVNGTLTAPTWDESTGVGGVLALTAKKLVLNANIDVIGKGFKGNTMTVNGTPDNCSVDPNTAYTLSSTASQSFTKGEGIVPDNTAVNRGRAPRANGGGSGISGDSGGGGGSSYGAGGMGGYRWCDELGSQDGGPDIPAGGLGGISLQNFFLEDKLFLGGAGGSGYVTTNNPSDATDGGGIVILFVDTLVGNGYSILADGTSPVAVNPVGPPDGGGGGGGGGSVLLNVNNIIDSLTVTADGGDGQNLNTNNYHGPGGGGGGGVLLYSLPTLPAAVTFAAVGGVSGVHSNSYDNGAEDGDDGGTFGLYVPIENVNYRANVDRDMVTPVCDIDDDGDGIPDIQEIYTGDHDNDGVLDWEDVDFCTSYFDTISGWTCATDGLPNPTADIDGDGYANFIDSDFPYCGTLIPGIDQICSNFDPDNDGIPSHLDLDSDNDGIPDIIEAGGADTNGDGQSDSQIDSDGDGLYDLFDNDDTDGPIGTSPCSPQPACLESGSFTVLPVFDSDNDTIPDYLDLDSDNDGVPDVVEVGGADVNGDGKLDNFGDFDDDGLADVVDAFICEDSVDFDTIGSGSFATYLGGSSTGIVNGANANGAPDGAFAQVYDPGDSIVLDFGSIYTSGTPYSLRWRRKATYGGGGTADMRVEESSDLATWNTNSVTPQENNQTFTTTNMTTENPVRYLRISTLTGSNDDIDFDAAEIGEPLIIFNVFEVCQFDVPLVFTGPDANNDGIPESYPFGDPDGDGVLNIRDLDSDNDGVPDVIEAGGVDTDGDGRYDGTLDEDGDGLLSAVDGDPLDSLFISDDGPGSNSANALSVTGADINFNGRPNSSGDDDMDGDGIKNQFDLDSDNDGIADVLEFGGTDTDVDGYIDGNSTDTDNDGFADGVDGDVGNDGTAENSGGALILTGIDGNGDGAPDSYNAGDADGDLRLNAFDIDSDNDGITDNVEAQATASFISGPGSDTDDDGLGDAYDSDNGGTNIVPVDTDSDGTPDYLDTDSDDDTYPDLIEGHDVNGDGIPDGTSPSNTGLPGTTDVDEDGLLDGWDNDTTSADMTNGALTPNSHPDAHNPGNDRDWRDDKDTDRDGISDFLDYDDDNDGIPDIDDGLGYDPDGNEDGDEFPNWLDVSDDGNGGDGSTTDYTDSNGDGIPDVYDTDRDGIPNHLDKDSDNDGIADILEAGGTDSNSDGEVDYPTPGVPSSMVDVDADGLADAIDNVNSGSGGGEVTSGTPLALADSDGDGIEDFVDIDSDGDGIIDNIEAQVTTGTPIQAAGNDSDLDGIDDAFDPDNAGTYIIPVDTDGDTTPDYIDTDSDDDGESDLLEGWDTDGDGVADISPANSDTDGDGLDDNFDNVATINGTTNPSNGGEDALDFPDADLGTSERDWREEPCSQGNADLSPNNTTTTASDICQDGAFTYYYDPTDDTKLLFAIEHKPASGNTNDFTLEVDVTASVDPTTAAGVYSAQDIPNEQATFVMGRYFNFNITSGSLNGPVNIRFFYDQEESDTLLATAQAWNAANAGSTAFVSGLRWFSMNAGTFDPSSADLQAAGIAGASDLPTSSSGTEDGVAFSEFSTSTLTGGGLAFTVGLNSVILPVELLSFDAYALDNKTVMTQWTTASEVNSDFFTVERSGASGIWNPIGRVAAAGNSNQIIDYQYMDQEALAGKSYYRLRQYDIDGQEDLSAVREVIINGENGIGAGNLNVYPNPSRDEINIRNKSENTYRLEIRNSLGQVVRYVTVEGEQTNKISGLGAGMYLLQNVSDRQQETISFIITK